MGKAKKRKKRKMNIELNNLFTKAILGQTDENENILAYAIITIQSFCYLTALSSDYTSLNPNYIQNKEINKMNEGEYLDFCNNAKNFNDLKDALLPVIINKLKSAQNLSNKLEDAKLHYYAIDSSFTKEDEITYNGLFAESIKTHFGI
jgi:hypothetical protein